MASNDYRFSKNILTKKINYCVDKNIRKNYNDARKYEYVLYICMKHEKDDNVRYDEHEITAFIIQATNLNHFSVNNLQFIVFIVFSN